MYSYCMPLVLGLTFGLQTLSAEMLNEAMSGVGRDHGTLSFRLGSGALATNSVDHGTENVATQVEVATLKPGIMSRPSRTSPGKNKKPTPIFQKICKSNPYLLGFLILTVLMHMMPNPGPDRNFNYRIPPSWSPENDQQYSFRAFMTDISLWIMLTDLQPHQQCAAIIMRLGGSAREMARMITPQEMMNGGMLNGVAVDAVTYLLGALHAKFSALEEESRLTAMTEMLAFNRKPSESINALLARYEVVRQRAAVEGQVVMSTEGCALQLLRACGIQAQHLFTLLQPFNGQLPQNDAQFQQLCTSLRRYGHISEGVPGNVASTLHGPPRQARPGAYMAESDAQALQAAARRTADAGGAGTYFGQAQAGVQPGSFWDTLLPQPLAGPDDPFAAWANVGGQPTNTASGESRQAEPWGTAGPGESRQAEPWNQGPTLAFPVNDWDEDDGTDSDTSSDDGMEDVGGPDTSQMTEAVAADAIYMAYRRAKKVWRRYTGKPVRKFRRHFRKFHRQSKGKGRGFFLTQDDVLAYLKGKGKGHRSHTSGKGHGRRKNPKDRNGNTLKCHTCGSEDHFQSN